ncbi:MAG TPA: LysR family transcriptional regulator, partial [Burkholderiaceae bacterium]|nr:LysR family transcriptional regulator [Burkholderiaceae bacterium]
PAFVAAGDHRLQRVLPAEADFTRTFWMSMPAEAKQLGRMQAVWTFLRSVAERQRALLLSVPTNAA